jgi:Tol biopolymer transport system component
MMGASSGGATRIVHAGQVQSLSFHPSGEILYITEVMGNNLRGRLKLIRLGNHAVELLEAPPAGYSGDDDVSVSPDGKYAVFVRYRTLECADLYLLPLEKDGREAGPAWKITSLDRRIQRPQWLMDNKSIIFVAGSLTQLATYSATLAGDPHNPATVEELKDWGSQIRYPSAARNRKRIVFE